MRKRLFCVKIRYMENTKAQKILKELAALYPDAQPALEFGSPYELLVAVILSAQCTDERVNKVTKVLFEKYNTPEKMLTLTQAELEKYIFSCGFYRNKAAHILSASRDIVEKFGGEVPATLEELQRWRAWAERRRTLFTRSRSAATRSPSIRTCSA